jgi:hypothetical protein
VLFAALVHSGARASEPPKAEPQGRELLRKEAAAVQPIVITRLGREFLAGVTDLPAIEPRIVFRDETTREYYSPRQAAAMDSESRAKLAEKELDETFYYNTKYGTPLAYVRAFDLVANARLEDVAGKRILDFGYGGVGQLRLLAMMGADVVGVEIDSLQPALYREPSDQGAIKGRTGRDGRITLVNGRFPADEAVTRAVGNGYDLFISKNTLKNGYLHPERPVDKRMLVDLGVDDGAFVRKLFEIVRPGGLVLIYNICPAPAPPDKPYIPWADGRCPFPKTMCESTGFRVLAYDQDDTPAARSMATLLGWGEGDDGMDLEKDLFAMYTLLQKP